MKKKVLLFIALILLCRYEVFAANCDYTKISRMKSIVSNINISYDYNIIENTAYFDVTLNNITSELYFVDSLNNKTYTFNDTSDGEITIKGYTKSGNYKFYSNLDECYGTILGTKYYTVPIYNKYFDSEYCKDVQNISVCQKWADVKYTEDEFKKLIDDYKKNLKKEEEKSDDKSERDSEILDKIANIYISYYYYFLGGIIIICGSIILIKRRDSKFKL